MHHHVRKETLHVAVDSEALALALRPRLQELNRTALLASVERVCNELSTPGQHLRIAKLDIDLGTIPIADLERVLVERFERELRNALRVAIQRVEREPSRNGLAQPSRDAQLELVERYLTGGTLPFWASASAFSLDDALMSLASTNPQALARLFTRLGASTRLRRRIAYQLSDESLQRLLRLVVPAHADQIVADVSELAAGPFLARATDNGPAPRDLLVLALDDQLRNLGRPYERDAFLQSMAVSMYRAGGRIAEGEDLASDESFRRLLHLLAPQHAERIVADAAVLAAASLGASRPDVGELQRDFWMVAIHGLLGTGGQSYDRSVFVRSALAVVAERDGRSQRAVLNAWLDVLPPGSAEGPGPAEPSMRSIAERLQAGSLFEASLDVSFVFQPNAAAPPATVVPYDRFEALRFYARHGVLPWPLVLRDPARTVADLLTALPLLPRSWLQTLASDVPAGEHLRTWHRLVGALPDERMMGLIAALIADADERPDATWSQVSTLVAQAADPALVYARFIVRLLDEARGGDAWWQAPLDTAAVDGIDGPSWDAPRITYVLSTRARGTASRGPHEPSSLHLLTRLVDEDVEGARHFLHALQEAGVRPSSLVDEVPSSRSVETLRSLLAPEAARDVTLLLDVLSALPSAERPATEHVQAAVAGEVLDRHLGPHQSQAFFETLLTRLFDPDRPSRDRREPPRGGHQADVMSALVTAAKRLVEAGAVTNAQMQPFTAAVRRSIARGPDEPLGAPAESAPATARSTATPADERTELAWRRRLGAPSGPPSDRRLPDDDVRRHALLRVLDGAPDTVRSALVARIGEPLVRQRWATALSESELVRIVYVLEPRRHRVLLDAAELLFSSWLDASPIRGPVPTRRTAFWSWLLRFLAESLQADRSSADAIHRDTSAPGTAPSRASSLEARLVASACEEFGAGERAPLTAPEPPGPRAENANAFLDAATRRAATLGRTALRDVLERDRPALVSRWRGDVPSPASPLARDTPPPLRPEFGESPARTSRPRARMAFSMEPNDASLTAEPIYIANAGLVLISPFLPQWFRSLDWLETVEGGTTHVAPDQISRAVHLLQVLVDGRTGTPEPLLCLNKLLCGVPLATPIERAIDPTPRELEVGQALSRSVIANWTIISNTSVEGLQETFLQREGRLERTRDGWRLLVQRKTVDVLLDHIPWSISTIIHAWMPEPIYVTW